MTKVRFVDWVALILCAIPFIAWFFLRDSLPERLPIHWDSEGQIDGWTGKDKLPLFLMLMTGISTTTYLLLRFIKRLDPKRTAQLNEGIALKIGVGIIIFMTAVNLLLIIPKDETFDMTRVVLVMVSLLFAFLGNLMYNIKPNYFVGIRLPWTLENEENWRQTHRVAGGFVVHWRDTLRITCIRTSAKTDVSDFYIIYCSSRVDPKYLFFYTFQKK